MRGAVFLLAVLLTAGCMSASDPKEAPDLGPEAPALTESLPTYEKFRLTPIAVAEGPLGALVDQVRGEPSNAATFTVPDRTGSLQLAIDFGDPSDQGRPAGEASLRITGPSEEAVYESGPVAGWRKVVEHIEAPAAGAYTMRAAAEGSWRIGVVVTYFPQDFTPGTIVNISKPDQTRVEHKFYPDDVHLRLGEPARITLFDFDPHYGVDTDQHNWEVPELDLRTEGRTNWGRVYTLDFTPDKKGTFDVQCRYHPAAMTGRLVIK